jgi:hypothetical protein
VERSIEGTGARGIALRGQATTLADASDFTFVLEKMNVHVVRKKNIRKVHI